MNYIDVLNNEEIISIYKKIELEDDSPYYHGMQHIQNTVSIMKKIIMVLNIDGITANRLLIATILHDIGRTINGNENHELNGRIFAEEFLRKNGYDDREEILEAIEFHDHKTDLDNRSSFTLLVALVDKLDTTYRRVNPNVVGNDKTEIYKHIIDLDIYMEDKLVISCESDKKVKSENFFNIQFVKWMLNILDIYCNRNKLKYAVCFDNNKIVCN